MLLKNNYFFMIYHYTATDVSGTISEGNIEGNDLVSVLQFLAARNLKPIKIKPIQADLKKSIGFFAGINLNDKIFITRYLALMLKVGTDLVSAITILISDYEKPSVKSFLLEIQSSLAKGQPFYQAFARYPSVFSPVFVNLIKAAEASGRLQETFESLSVSLSKEADLRGKVQGALIYPVILIGVSSVVFSFLSLFALPKIADIFLQSGITPPLFSRVVFAVGLFFGAHAFLFIFAALAIVSGSVYFFGFTLPGRRMLDRTLSRTPVIKTIYHELAIQRFASTFSALMKANLPIIQTMEITADVVGSQEFRESLLRIAHDGLAKGVTIGDAFRRETIFPKVVTNLIAVSEKAGHIEEVLATLADFYESNVDASLKTAVSITEPILLIGMGLIAGTIALAIILPIYQLTSSF